MPYITKILEILPIEVLTLTTLKITVLLLIACAIAFVVAVMVIKNLEKKGVI